MDNMDHAVPLMPHILEPKGIEGKSVSKEFLRRSHGPHSTSLSVRHGCVAGLLTAPRGRTFVRGGMGFIRVKI